jgi:hypothetical protein
MQSRVKGAKCHYEAGKDSERECSMKEAFGICKNVSAFKPSAVPGVEAPGEWEFCSGLNVIVGASGSGKTRVLKVLKTTAGPVDFDLWTGLPVPGLASQGQALMGAVRHLLNIQPVGTCLMIDDVACRFDQFNLKLFIKMLIAHQRQVIMTCSPDLLERIKPLCSGNGVRIFKLSLPRTRT